MCNGKETKDYIWHWYWSDTARRQIWRDKRKEILDMRNRSWKKAGHRLLAGALAFACVCAAGNIPVKAAKAKAAPETSVVEQIWQEVVEEYGLKQEETELVYQTDAMGRSTQVPEAVKSETVNEDGVTEDTYYVPCVFDENGELVNVFERIQGRNYSGTEDPWNVIFSYTALYNVVDSHKIPRLFLLPIGLSVNYKLNGSGTVTSITQLTGSYEFICNLYASPDCIYSSDPVPAYQNRSIYAQFSTGTPQPGITYHATMTNMPNGYLVGFDGSHQTGEIKISFSYITKSGNQASYKLERQLHCEAPIEPIT